MDEINILTYAEGLNQIAKLAVKREIVPVFGAGFTAGCEASDGVVPDSSQAKDGMSKLILENSKHFTPDDLCNLDFYSVAGLFFENVPIEIRSEYFERNYTGTVLFQDQIDFLNNINWPYLYTLNIDDGIERCAGFSPICPYHKFRRPSTSTKLLYKLHGDAIYESKYISEDGSENIVFSQDQYMQEITNENNTDICKALLSDYSQRHMLFIGCSLQGEQDLQYIYKKSRKYAQETYRITIREKAPNNIEIYKLKAHGINEIILVPTYGQFYHDFLNAYQQLQAETRETLYEFMNPKIEYKKGKSESLELLSGNNIFDISTNTFSKGELHVLRIATSKIIKEFKTESCVLLKGRRFSGKTYVLCSLVEKCRKRDVYYFPSTSFVDEEVITRLFSVSKDCLFLFDSNSVTPDVYSIILNYVPKASLNNNKIVLAANSNDNYLLTRLNCGIVELENSFDFPEISLNNKAADSFGLTRRKKGQTNIDYLYVLKKQQNISIPIFDKESIVLTPLENSVLVALSALDKLYYSDLVALGFSSKNISDFCKKLSPFVEITATTSDEATRHSSSKMVHNSKLALIEYLKNMSISNISTSIQYIVQRFKPDYSRRRLYIEIILFDTLNQLFSGRTNSKELISTVYAELQPLLKDDLHYWLQRAKSIYRTSSTIESLNEAYTYAKKAYLDGSVSLTEKAALTTALISCAIGEQVSENMKLGYFEECVILSYESVFSDYFKLHPRYLHTELPIGENTHSEQRIISACNYVISNSDDCSLIWKSNEILNQFKELEKQSK